MQYQTIAAGILIVLAATTGASAQSDQTPSDTGTPPQGLITCWYNASGAFTGSDSAQAGAQAGGPYQTGQGDYTWSYNIAAPNGQSCPQTKPGG